MTGEAAGVAPGKMRVEHDLLGERLLPEEARFGIQTLRATENFRISGVSLAQFNDFVVGLAHVKKAAALANHELGLLGADKARAIAAACDEIAAGRMHDEFVVDMVQGGAGTSTNMNADEVIANRALELMGHGRGDYQWLHPNDDVNCSQSTNDAYPTAVKIGVYLSMQRTLSAMGELKAALVDRAARPHPGARLRPLGGCGRRGAAGRDGRPRHRRAQRLAHARGPGSAAAPGEHDRSRPGGPSRSRPCRHSDAYTGTAYG